MKTELYNAIKMIHPEKLTNTDLDDLLCLFKKTKNDLVRNQIAFIFQDTKFEKAIPHIIRKINDPEIQHNNGSLVHALSGFNMKDYILELVSIICKFDYEPRLMAFEIVDEIKDSISREKKDAALDMLRSYLNQFKSTPDAMKPNSKYYFVLETIKLLE